MIFDRLQCRVLDRLCVGHVMLGEAIWALAVSS